VSASRRNAAHVRRRARELGFDAVGITDLAPTPHADALDRWLARGMAGTMSYMGRQAARRKAPATIVPGATHAVVVLRSYTHRDPPHTPGTGRVAKYARARDYHHVLAAPLRALAETLQALGGPDTIARAYVDAGPVPERELAQRAGLGWIGKNTMLIDPARGSFTFIGSILTDLPLVTDDAFDLDRCGSCTRCLDACPTGAFVEPRVLDATRCISYLTIEHRGAIDPNLADRMGDWVFGCDICQDVCPWNGKFADAAADPLPATRELADLDLVELARIDDEEFDRRYGWTPLERPGAAGLRRNARIAVRNQRREAGCRTG
jgi:epoxyqueuosine reductase